MKAALINGSPKGKNSASNALLGDLTSCFSKDMETAFFGFQKPGIDENSISELKECQVWVFAFPLYVDGIPSHLLSCLCQIEKTGICNQDIVVYGIVNCGFYEGKQNAAAIEILRNWCNRIGLHWGMGLGVGGGGSLGQIKSAPLGKGPKTTLGKALHTLQGNIEHMSSGYDIFLSVDMPRWLYKCAAEMGWKQLIKKNGGKVQDLGRRME